MPSKKTAVEQTLKPIKSEWQTQVKDYVTDLTWSPDSSKLVATDASGFVSIIDPAGGRVEQTWLAHGPGALKASWSASGKYLASCGQDGKAQIYDGLSFSRLASLEHGSVWVEHLCWHSKEDIFLTAAGKDLTLWSADGSLMQRFSKHPATIADVMWNPAAFDFFATSTYSGVRLWNLKDSEAKRFLEWKGSLLNIAYSPNGKILAAGCQDGAAHVWLLPSGNDLFMNGYPTKVRELSWDKTSRYLATGGGTEVIVWNFAGKGPSGSKPQVLPGHESFISVLGFAPQGLKLASGGLDGNVFIWDIGKPNAPVLAGNCDSEVTGFAWRLDGQALAASFASGQIALFEL